MHRHYKAFAAQTAGMSLQAKRPGSLSGGNTPRTLEEVGTINLAGEAVADASFEEAKINQSMNVGGRQDPGNLFPT